MTEHVLIALYASLGAAAVLIFLSHLAPRFGKGRFAAELEPPEIFGKKLRHRESHFVGVLVHFIFYGAWGLIYALLIEFGLLEAGVTSFAILTVLVTGISSCIIMPIEGYGFFGKKHDPWFALDSFVTNTIWVMLFALFLKLWQG